MQKEVKYGRSNRLKRIVRFWESLVVWFVVVYFFPFSFLEFVFRVNSLVGFFCGVVVFL